MTVKGADGSKGSWGCLGKMDGSSYGHPLGMDVIVIYPAGYVHEGYVCAVDVRGRMGSLQEVYEVGSAKVRRS